MHIEGSPGFAWLCKLDRSSSPLCLLRGFGCLGRLVTQWVLPGRLVLERSLILGLHPLLVLTLESMADWLVDTEFETDEMVDFMSKHPDAWSTVAWIGISCLGACVAGAGAFASFSATVLSLSVATCCWIG